jgi:hypothetical protein
MSFVISHALAVAFIAVAAQQPEGALVLGANAWYKVYQAPALPFPATARGTAPS